MRPGFSLICIFIFVLNACSQKAGTFELLGGVRYRMTPVHFAADKYSTVIDQNPIVLQEDAHLSGLSFLVGLNYFFAKDLFVSYEGYLRYDEFLTTIDSATLASLENKKLILDHQFSLQYNFIQTKRLCVSSGIGFSFNNLNTGYSFSKAVYNPQLNTYVVINGVDDYKFNTFDLPIMIKFKNNVALGLKTSCSLKHKFFLHDQLLLFSLTARYNFEMNNKH